MNPLEYEMAVRRVRQSQQSKDFLPFYRNTLKPILQHSVYEALSGDNQLSPEELVNIRAFAKIVKDMEVVLTRLIVQGENAGKVLKKVASTRGDPNESDT